MTSIQCLARLRRGPCRRGIVAWLSVWLGRQRLWYPSVRNAILEGPVGCAFSLPRPVRGWEGVRGEGWRGSRASLALTNRSTRLLARTRRSVTQSSAQETCCNPRKSRRHCPSCQSKSRCIEVCKHASDWQVGSIEWLTDLPDQACCHNALLFLDH